MSPLVLFEDAGFAGLLPLTYWRCIFVLRCGRKSLLDNAACALAQPVEGIWARSWIAGASGMRCQTPANRPVTEKTILFNGRWLVSRPVEFQPAPFVATCRGSIAYIACDKKLAEILSPDLLLDRAASQKLSEEYPSGEVEADFLEYPWDLVVRNAEMLRRQWTGDDRAADGKISSSAYLINPDHIHVDERCEIKPTAVIDATNGPVYISNDVQVNVHTYLEGPAYIGPGCVIKPHTSIRAGTSIGSMCKVGGEISASILSAYCSKQHEGFLGHAYVGGWVNLGAGTTNSNLKNTYGTVNVQFGDRVVETGQRFLGCIVGDFTRTGIGELLPTGAVVGFGAMLATGGLVPKYVPSFGWLTDSGVQKTDPARLLQTARVIMAERNVAMTDEEAELLMKLPALAEQYGI